MSKTSKNKRHQLQQELLSLFEGDFYQEKKVGDKWYIKMFNGNTGNWQVAQYSEKSYKAYKSFSQSKERLDYLLEKDD